MPSHHAAPEARSGAVVSATLIDLPAVLEFLDECEKRVGYSLRPLRHVAEVAAANSAPINMPRLGVCDEPERERYAWMRFYVGLLSAEIQCEREGLIFRVSEEDTYDRNTEPPSEWEKQLGHEDDARAAELCVRLLTGDITEERAREILARDE